jgi:hypothetical protein
LAVPVCTAGLDAAGLDAAGLDAGADEEEEDEEDDELLQAAAAPRHAMPSRAANRLFEDLKGRIP